MRENANEPLVHNAWYIAAWPEELENGVIARTILDEALVIFRGPDGTAAALEDRCCHRSAPLSQGWIGDKGITCGLSRAGRRWLRRLRRDTWPG